MAYKPRVLSVADGGSGAATLTGVLKGNGTSAFTAAAAGTDYVSPGGALGTPASGTLTNCTGLPGSGLASGTLGSGVGFSATSYSAGTKSSGTYTPAASDGNFQHATNGGAHTLAPPSTVCTIIVEYLNNSSAGAITTSGFTKVTGDAFTTTDTNKFQCFITKTQNYSSLNVVALQ